ncbi:hypothetical protein TcWFU_004229 [Taenia crassiceps]|uniref:Uncharacterized protein n=1 Tax=Taenia crassiceps TaxID=6207 RepID=A0ABR4QDF8_9CEST
MSQTVTLNFELKVIEGLRRRTSAGQPGIKTITGSPNVLFTRFHPVSSLLPTLSLTVLKLGSLFTQSWPDTSFCF